MRFAMLFQYFIYIIVKYFGYFLSFKIRSELELECRAGAGAAPFYTAPAKKGGSGSTTLEPGHTFVVTDDYFPLKI